ncbi:hypothetical protein VTI74DRAFT_3426 [Chaetomium olivicolor]
MPRLYRIRSTDADFGASGCRSPDMPGTPKDTPPFTRADWDELWGALYDAPDAKMVIVQRDFEKQVVLDRSMGTDEDLPLLDRALPSLFWLTVGTRSMYVIRKLSLGISGARTRAECIINVQEAYETYYQEVRRLVPEERHLEHKLGREPRKVWMCRLEKYLIIPQEVKDPEAWGRVEREKQWRGKNRDAFPSNTCNSTGLPERPLKQGLVAGASTVQ